VESACDWTISFFKIIKTHFSCTFRQKKKPVISNQDKSTQWEQEPAARGSKIQHKVVGFVAVEVLKIVSKN
jgi:hypothetical protein